jgi:hypothetical protein
MSHSRGTRTEGKSKWLLKYLMVREYLMAPAGRWRLTSGGQAFHPARKGSP